MTRIVVASIVEGDGEVPALPILIRRIGQTYCPDTFIDVLKPIRMPASSLIKKDDPCLSRAVGIAAKKLAEVGDGSARKFILILIDAEGACAAIEGPIMKQRATEIASHLDITCVIAVDEYETWFVAAAGSLSKYLDVEPNNIPSEPEKSRTKKKWISERIRAGTYKETVDQPKFSAEMDLALCHARSPSFRKLCREIERMARVEVPEGEGRVLDSGVVGPNPW